MKCQICKKEAQLARISGALICQPCNRKLEADVAARYFGGAIPPSAQAEWDRAWNENLVADGAVDDLEAAAATTSPFLPAKVDLVKVILGFLILAVIAALIYFGYKWYDEQLNRQFRF